jgi:hypothetical protein
VLIKLVKGKAREVHPLMWTVAGLFVVYFALGPIKLLLNPADQLSPGMDRMRLTSLARWRIVLAM